MCGNQIFRCPLDDVVDSRNQNTRVTIFLATNCVHVEQHRPHRVVHACANGWEIEVDGVIRITRRILILNSKTSHRDGTFFTQYFCHWNMARCEWRMHWVLVEEPKSNVDSCIRAFCWHHNSKLLHNASRIRW